MSLKGAIDLIKKSKHVLISTHMNPDPDALCSELALYYFLRAKGKKVTILNNEAVPDRFMFLPGAKYIQAYKPGRHYPYDLAVVLDCGALDRIGVVVGALDHRKPLLNIDHHITNDYFGTLNVVESKSSSTAEILFELLSKAKVKLNPMIATNLYAGIMTDTGSFRYENTTARTHEIAAELRRFKFSAIKLYQQLYEMIPLHDMKQFTKVVSGFKEHFGGRVLSVELGEPLLAQFSEGFDLRDTIFRLLRSIKHTEVIVIFTEVEKNGTRVNFRSSGRVNVAKIAHFFKGGGHHNASGCVIHKNIQQSKQIILKKIKELI